MSNYFAQETHTELAFLFKPLVEILNGTDQIDNEKRYNGLCTFEWHKLPIKMLWRHLLYQNRRMNEHRTYKGYKLYTTVRYTSGNLRLFEHTILRRRRLNFIVLLCYGFPENTRTLRQNVHKVTGTFISKFIHTTSAFNF